MPYVELTPTHKRVQEVASKLLEEQPGEFAGRKAMKRIANLLVPDPKNPLSYAFPIGISKIGKENIWRATSEAIKEGKNVHYGFHATSNPRSLLESGLELPLLEHESRKGRGFFLSGDPFLAIAQRTAQPYVRPREFIGISPSGHKQGVVRMVLAPEKTFVINEKALETAIQGFPRQAVSSLMRKAAPLTKLEEADLGMAFRSKGVTEYIVRDPSIIKALSWRNISKNLAEWHHTPIPEPSFAQIADSVSGAYKSYHPSEARDWYNQLMKAGRIERGVQEYGLSPPAEWTAGDVGERMIRRKRHLPLEERLAQLLEAGVAEGGYQPGISFSSSSWRRLPLTKPIYSGESLMKSKYPIGVGPEHPGWGKGGSPIPLTPNQQHYLRAIFGDDLEFVSTPLLRQALAIVKASPLGFSSIHPETVKTVQMALGMILKP